MRLPSEWGPCTQRLRQGSGDQGQGWGLPGIWLEVPLEVGWKPCREHSLTSLSYQYW